MINTAINLTPITLQSAPAHCTVPMCCAQSGILLLQVRNLLYSSECNFASLSTPNMFLIWFRTVIIGNSDLLVLILLLKLIRLVCLPTFLFLVSSGRILTRLHLCVTSCFATFSPFFNWLIFIFFIFFLHLNSLPFLPTILPHRRSTSTFH